MSIEVTKLPTKTKYLESKDKLDLTDGILTIHYDNDITKEINLSEAEISGFDNTKVGKQTLTVTYQEKTTTFEVEIIATLSHLSFAIFTDLCFSTFRTFFIIFISS